MKFQLETKSRSSWRLAKWRLRLRFTLNLALSLRARERLRIAPKCQHKHRSNLWCNQILFFPPLTKGDQRGILRRAYSHPPQRSGSPERKASIWQPSKEAGQVAASSPKMCSGLRSANLSLREDRPKSKRQYNSPPCGASSASG